MAIYSNGTLVVDAANVQAPRLTGTLPALNASSLTNLDATDLSGALPAIDGSNLTGVVGSTTEGAVGTYHHIYFEGTSTSIGSTSAGSNLRTRSWGWYNCWTNHDTVNGSLSGTWRNMDAQALYKGGSNQRPYSLWVRTA